MNQENLEKLLSGLADAEKEQASPWLAQRIKQQIPHALMPRRGGLDTINIIIDLKISKLAAAAAIILSMIVFTNFLGGRGSTGGGIYQDGKLMVKYLFGNISAGDDLPALSAGRIKYDFLVHQGKEIVYYGDSIAQKDSNAILMQWKLSDDKYMVIFADLRERQVSGDELIKLQAHMLEKK
ncbi:MAG: hypothetical protein NTW55_03170 [Planctomycetota bacterium]|nr:hypothetical protein [Planctomycetota bacterium]